MSVEKCKWCGAEFKYNGYYARVFKCGSTNGVEGGFVNMDCQTDACKLACAERRIAELEEELTTRYERISELEVAAKSSSRRIVELKEANARLAEQRKAAQLEVQRVAKKVADLERQLSERAEGKDWWLVVGGKNIDAESVIHDGPIDAMQYAQIYGCDVIHVREVVVYAKHDKAVVCDAEQSAYGIHSVTQWPVSPAPICSPFTNMGDGWFRTDAIQIIEYDWRYAGWTDGTRRYGPICCTGPLSTLDTVSLLDEWGNDLLTWEGMQKHCNEIEKRLDETDSNRAEAWARYGEVCKVNVTLETRLEHAMKLLQEVITESYAGRITLALTDLIKNLIAKYEESPLDVPNPQGEQLKKAMELLRAIRYDPSGYRLSNTLYKRLEALVEKYGEGGDDERL